MNYRLGPGIYPGTVFLETPADSPPGRPRSRPVDLAALGRAPPKSRRWWTGPVPAREPARAAKWRAGMAKPLVPPEFRRRLQACLERKRSKRLDAGDYLFAGADTL